MDYLGYGVFESSLLTHMYCIIRARLSLFELCGALEGKHLSLYSNCTLLGRPATAPSSIDLWYMLFEGRAVRVKERKRCHATYGAILLDWLPGSEQLAEYEVG